MLKIKGNCPPPRGIQSQHAWRNDITGLRALAVLPVLLFHAFPRVLQGGFFGVDIFFVISGFLISGIIFRGLAGGSFSYRNFYAKRIRRILPNLTLLLAVVGVAGWFCLFPNELKDLGRHIYSSAAFCQNIRLLLEIGYFTEDALRKPLLHLWSLAIEEQFYIVFPIFCALLWRYWKSKTSLFVASVLITVSSLVACFLVADKNFAFYFPLTRFWELGAGIILAALETFGLFDFKTVAKRTRDVISVVGFLVIVFAMTGYRAALYGHPGFFTLLPVIGALLLIVAQADAIVNRTLLSVRPMVFVGLISYSLYLWHWPLLSFLYICEPQTPQWMTWVALGLSFVFATVVYYFVEEPTRRCKRFAKGLVIGLLILLVAEAVVGRVIRLADGFVKRYPAHEQIEKIRAVGEWDLFFAAKSFQYDGVRIATPTPEVFPSILFVGDSHLVQYFGRAEVLSQKTRQSIGFIGRTSCVIFSKNGCKEEANALYKLLADKRVKKLVIAERWDYITQKNDYGEGIRELKEALEKRPDLKTYVLLDYPWTPDVDGQQGDYDPMRHVPRRKDFDSIIVPYPKDDLWKRSNDIIARDLAGHAQFIDPQSYVCPNQKCDLLKWYKDDDHLQPMRLKEEGVWLDPIFN